MAKEKWLVKRFCQRLEQIADAPCVSSQQKAIGAVWEQMVDIWDADPSQYTLDDISVFQNALDSATWDNWDESVYLGNQLVELLLAERSIQLLQSLPTTTQEVGYL